MSSIPRSHLLRYKPTIDLIRIPFVHTYNDQLEPFLKHIKREWTTLSRDSDIQELFPQPPVIARRQPPNLRQFLVRSKLNATSTTIQGNIQCGKARCRVCDHMITDTEIILSPSGCKLRPGSFNCDTCNVVYLITCSLCPNIQYIGQTSTSFRLRFNNHKSSIRLNRSGFPVAEHFNLPDHSLNNLKFAILQGNLTDNSKRTLVETQLIHRTGTYVHGLNRDLSFLSGFNFYK